MRPATGCRRSKRKLGEHAKQECCVCLSATTTCTPCGHPLCTDCWDMLPSLLCPLCRRGLPKSSGAIPAWFSGAAGSAMRPSASGSALSTTMPRPESIAARRSKTATDLAFAASELQLDLLPSCLAKKVKRTLQREAKDKSAHGLEAILECADAVVRDAVDLEDVSATDVVRAVVSILSKLTALRLSKLRLFEVAGLAPVLAAMLERSALVVSEILPVIDVLMQREARQILQIDCMQWEAFADLVQQMQVFRELPVFADVSEEMTSGLAQQVVELVRRAGMEQLPVALCTTREILKPWPAVAQEATAALRHLVPIRLLRLAQRWASEGMAGPDALPSSPSGRSSTLSSEPLSPLPPRASTATISAVSVAWWVDVLRTSGVGGLLDRAGLQEICDVLAPGLAREGVRTDSTESWSAESRQFVVARQLARELFERPEETQYNPAMRRILFRCPVLAEAPAAAETRAVSPVTGGGAVGASPVEHARGDALPARRLRRESLTLQPIPRSLDGRPGLARSRSAIEVGRGPLSPVSPGSPSSAWSRYSRLSFP
mmetsp:Transcript_133580/g.337335  ORF Transcript_133580/g.337335 Transcript_133580/m.337335 type:complete len:547 (+) Transcript_133580:107-1747(+)